MKKTIVSSVLSLLVLATPCLAGNVGTADLLDGSVTTAKISAGAVTSVKLAPSSVTAAAMTDGAVTTGKLADGAVTASKLAAGAVTSDVLADGAVTDAKIYGLISSAKIEQPGLDADTLDGRHAADLALAGHGHVQGDVFGLETALAGKALADHTHDDLYQGKVDNVITVATSGGDFTSIQEALDSVSSGAVIKVMPGVYAGGISFYNKTQISIIGSGPEQTIIRAEGAAHVLQVTSSNDINISGLGLHVDPNIAGYRTAIKLIGSTRVRVQGNKLVGAGMVNTSLFGMDIRPGMIDLQLDILDNEILGFDAGMYLENGIQGGTSSTASTTIRGNRIVGHGEFSAGQSGGIHTYGYIPNLRILENEISNNWQGDITLSGGQTYTKRVVVDSNRLFSLNVGLNISGVPVAISNNVINSGGLGVMIYGSYSSNPAGNSLGSVLTGNLIMNTSRGLSVSDYPVTIVNNVFDGSSDIYINNPSAKTLLSNNVYRTILLEAGTTVAGKFNSDLNGNLVAPQ